VQLVRYKRRLLEMFPPYAIMRHEDANESSGAPFGGPFSSLFATAQIFMLVSRDCSCPSDILTTVLLELPVSVIEGADLTSLQPT
jgi:hypothetical protein